MGAFAAAPLKAAKAEPPSPPAPAATLSPKELGNLCGAVRVAMQLRGARGESYPLAIRANAAGFADAMRKATPQHSDDLDKTKTHAAVALVEDASLAPGAFVIE